MLHGQTQIPQLIKSSPVEVLLVSCQNRLLHILDEEHNCVSLCVATCFCLCLQAARITHAGSGIDHPSTVKKLMWTFVWMQKSVCVTQCHNCGFSLGKSAVTFTIVESSLEQNCNVNMDDLSPPDFRILCCSSSY